MALTKRSSKAWVLKSAMIFLFLSNAILLGAVIYRYLLVEQFSYKQQNSNVRHYMSKSTVATSMVMTRKYLFLQEFLPDCPSEGHNTVGHMQIDLTEAEKSYANMANISYENATNNTKTILGRFLINDGFNAISIMFQPAHCQPSSTVAIIIPFRDRDYHLRILIGHLIPMLKRQLIRFSIFIITQDGTDTFNKGRLLNTGFQFAKDALNNGHPFDCFIFHDVDLLAEYDTLQYRCAEGRNVRHLSAALNSTGYKWLAYGITVGGVLAMTKEQFEKVNGYSNQYWGWGGEDDDMFKRIQNHSLGTERPNQLPARYTMVSHEHDKGNSINNNRHQLLRTANKRFESDGMSSLNTKICSIQRYALFINVIVDVGEKP